MTGESQEAWSRLWRTGVLHSCAHGIAGNYDGAIAEFWRAQCDGLADGARVVDIGTGNGPLTLLVKLAAEARHIRLDIHGVDLADIDPPAHVSGHPGRYDGIVFHPRTSAAALPFPDGSVDLLISQYGFEYAPRDPALRESMRVIGRRGRAAFLLHSHDSLVAQVTGRQLEGCAWLLQCSTVWDRARALIRVLGSAGTPSRRAHLGGDSDAEATRQAFNAAAGQLIDKTNELQSPQVLLNAIQHLRNALMAVNHLGATASLSLLEESMVSLSDEWRRLQQMYAAMFDETDLDSLKGHFEMAGYRTRLAPLDQAEGVRMGWSLTASPR